YMSSFDLQNQFGLIKANLDGLSEAETADDFNVMLKNIKGMSDQAQQLYMNEVKTSLQMQQWAAQSQLSEQVNYKMSLAQPILSALGAGSNIDWSALNGIEFSNSSANQSLEAKAAYLKSIIAGNEPSDVTASQLLSDKGKILGVV